MSLTAATTNGGRRNKVHSEFDDGYVIGFFDECGYIPLTFSWDDEYGCVESAVLSADELYHNRLMRTDGGLRVDDSVQEYTFDWHQMNRVRLNIPSDRTEAPVRAPRVIDGYELNSATNTSLEGVRGRTRTYTRLDRYYWTPDHVTQNEQGPSPLFTLEQVSHDACLRNPGSVCHHDTFPEDQTSKYKFYGGR